MLLFLFLIVLIFFTFFSKVLKIGFIPAFLVVNFSVILALIVGGTLSRSFLGNDFVHPYADVFIFSILIIPALIFFCIFLTRKPGSKKVLSSGMISSRVELEYLDQLLINISKFSLKIFVVLITLNILTMISEGLFFRSYYRYIIEEKNIGLLFAFTYTTGVFSTINFLFKKKYIYFIVILLLLSLLGKKHPVVFCILLPLFYNIFKLNKINLRLIFLGIIGFVVLIQLGKFFTAGADVTAFEQLSSTLDYYYNFNYFLYNYPLGIDGGDIFLTSFYYYIPRYFWEAKPVVYGFLLIHEKLFYREMLINFYPSVFEEYATPIADFGMFFGAIYLIIYKVFFYLVMFLRLIGIRYKVCFALFLIDPLSAFYFLSTSFIFRNK